MQARPGDRDRLRRAAAHLKSSVRYERKGLSKKAAAHFGRVMYYGTGDERGNIFDLPDEILEMIFRDAFYGENKRAAMIALINKKTNIVMLEMLSKLSKHLTKMSTEASIVMLQELRASRPFNFFKKALVRKTTIEFVREIMNQRNEAGRDGPVDSIIKKVKKLTEDHWYHLDFCYEFHGLVDIKLGKLGEETGVTEGEKTKCASMLQGFLDHLDSDQPCIECAILKRDETRAQIKQIIEGTFAPKSIRSMETGYSSVITSNMVKYYTMGKILDASDYGHLCIWRLDRVVSTNSMFDANSLFKAGWNDDEWDVRLWDTRSVKSMNSMFYGNQGKMSGVETWNVESVNDMSSMFRDATNFNRDLSRWKLSEGTILTGIFAGAIGMEARSKPKMVILKEAAEAAEAAEADKAAEEDEFESATAGESARKGEKRR